MIMMFAFPYVMSVDFACSVHMRTHMICMRTHINVILHSANQQIERLRCVEGVIKPHLSVIPGTAI